MFQQALNALDTVFRQEPGYTTELDYTEQASWLLFPKYLDDLEQARETEAGLADRPYRPIIDARYRWAAWASPRRADGTPDRDRALNGSASLGPMCSPTISRLPSVVTATAIMAATLTMRPPSRTLR